MELRRDRASGLGLYARRHIGAGTLVLSEKPFIKVTCESTKSRTCAVCFMQCEEDEDDFVIRCGGCNELWYCSPSCTQSAVAIHTDLECACLSTPGKTSNRSSSRQKTSSSFFLLTQGFNRLSSDVRDVIRIAARLHATGVARVNSALCTVRSAKKPDRSDAISATIHDAVEFVSVLKSSNPLSCISLRSCLLQLVSFSSHSASRSPSISTQLLGPSSWKPCFGPRATRQACLGQNGAKLPQWCSCSTCTSSIIAATPTSPSTMCQGGRRGFILEARKREPGRLVPDEDEDAEESMLRHGAGGACESSPQHGSEFVLGSHGPPMAMVAVRDGEFCSLSMYCIVRKTILPALPL